MIPLTFNDVQLLLAGSVFILGFILILIGAFVMVTRGYSREINALAKHTASLGQKGVAQDVTGLVNSASELVASITALVRTATGIGVFLIMLGLIMLGASYWVLQQVAWPISI